LPGAEVFVGDTYQGSTNGAGELKILGKLSPGEHSIRVVKDKYEDGRLRKSFAAGSETVEIRLNRKVSPNHSAIPSWAARRFGTYRGRGRRRRAGWSFEARGRRFP
jgi:hypothetical protein